MTLVAIAFLLVVAMGGCALTTTGTPDVGQTAINAGVTSYQALDQAIIAADAAVKTGALHGQDAINAAQGFAKAKAGLDIALTALKAGAAAASPAASSPTTPSSGAKP